ncbi:MAG TPA: OB-fold domain-containing protein [Thermodesulfobacteriota bacterium]|nr:OB-fold domain-containing protein [Thermodesulfobacteriota bacterium]
MAEMISEKDEVMFPELFRTDEQGRVRLVAGYSKESNNWTFPKYLADPVSFSDEVEERLLSPTGELHSFTIVRRSMPEFPVPYALALVDFPEGVRVMAQVETSDPEGLKIGQKMGVTIGTVKKSNDGKDVKSYKFIPVKN